jgi:hypothetical protein
MWVQIPCVIELGALLTKVERSLGSGLSTVVNPDVIMSCLTCNTLSVWLCNAHSLAHHWQTHLSDATAGLCNACSLACHWQTHLPDAISLCPSAVPKEYHEGELCREACRDTQTNIRLDSHLVREWKDPFYKCSTILHVHIIFDMLKVL